MQGDWLSVQRPETFTFSKKDPIRSACHVHFGHGPRLLRQMEGEDNASRRPRAWPRLSETVKEAHSTLHTHFLLFEKQFF